MKTLPPIILFFSLTISSFSFTCDQGKKLPFLRGNSVSYVAAQLKKKHKKPKGSWKYSLGKAPLNIYKEWNFGFGKGRRPARNAVMVLQKNSLKKKGHVGLVIKVKKVSGTRYDLEVHEGDWKKNRQSCNVAYQVDLGSNLALRESSQIMPLLGFVYTEKMRKAPSPSKPTKAVVDSTKKIPKPRGENKNPPKENTIGSLDDLLGEKGNKEKSTPDQPKYFHPCSECGYPGPYDRDWYGDGTQHLAKDYPAFVDDKIHAISKGIVHKYYPAIGGFGGANPSKTGPALVVRHKKPDGTAYFALYGHMSSDLKEGSKVKANQVIGTIRPYYYGNSNIPHLHLGIWDASENFPTSRLGYGSKRSFVNPVPFLEKLGAKK